VNRDVKAWLLPVAAPMLLVLTILGLDVVEGPKTAYVGLLATVPMLSAVFGTPRQTAIAGITALLAAFIFGSIAEDGNVPAQRVRLIAIALFVVIAVVAAQQRERRESALLSAREGAALSEQMRIRANTDELTGLLNRRGIMQAVGGREHAESWCVAIADCDRFKLINDEHGHSVGDEYLKSIALRLRAALSEADLMARWGGDEFLFALPLPIDKAAMVFNRLHNSATSEPVRTSAGPLTSAITFGISAWLPGEAIGEAIRRADRAMYSGKSNGSNRVVIDH
jgi:diguanylate cyclase (GGDEF)-like protein